jgi:hypothetical protein
MCIARVKFGLEEKRRTRQFSGRQGWLLQQQWAILAMAASQNSSSAPDSSVLSDIRAGTSMIGSPGHQLQVSPPRTRAVSVCQCLCLSLSPDHLSHSLRKADHPLTEPTRPAVSIIGVIYSHRRCGAGGKDHGHAISWHCYAETLSIAMSSHSKYLQPATRPGSSARTVRSKQGVTGLHSRPALEAPSLSWSRYRRSQD